MGAPNYFSDLCAEFKLFYERLVFPYLTYNTERLCCNEHKIPVILIMTSNAPEDYYTELLAKYKQTLDTFIGPTEVLVSGETLQVKDYSKFNWTLFDPEQRKQRRETIFPQELQKAFSMGAEMARKI